MNKQQAGSSADIFQHLQECDICPEKFVFKKDLEIHKKKMKDTHLKCSICNHVNLSTQMLEAHMKRAHPLKGDVVYLQTPIDLKVTKPWYHLGQVREIIYHQSSIWMFTYQGSPTIYLKALEVPTTLCPTNEKYPEEIRRAVVVFEEMFKQLHFYMLGNDMIKVRLILNKKKEIAATIFLMYPTNGAFLNVLQKFRSEYEDTWNVKSLHCRCTNSKINVFGEYTISDLIRIGASPTAKVQVPIEGGHDPNPWNAAYLATEIVNNVKSVSGLLDIGCGNGARSLLLAGLFPKVIGVDVEEKIDGARLLLDINNKPNCTFINVERMTEIEGLIQKEKPDVAIFDATRKLAEFSLLMASIGRYECLNQVIVLCPKQRNAKDVLQCFQSQNEKESRFFAQCVTLFGIQGDPSMDLRIIKTVR